MIENNIFIVLEIEFNHAGFITILFSADNQYFIDTVYLIKRHLKVNNIRETRKEVTGVLKVPGILRVRLFNSKDSKL